MTIHKVLPEEWRKCSELVHLAVFDEPRGQKMDRYNFAIVCADETQIFAYSTIVELDQHTAYMQHGGAMPEIKKTVNVKRLYHAMIEWVKAHYKRISTRIQNTNVAMLKLALSEGLIIDGVTAYGRDVFLSLSWGFKDE